MFLVVIILKVSGLRLNILALETSSQHCSVALQYTDSQPAESTIKVITRLDATALSHSRSLLSLIDDVLKEANLSLAELDAIAVARGPGSFTGLRIGIAVAQGLAFGHQLPVLPISSLAAVAYNAFLYWDKQTNSIPAASRQAVLATMDARMGEVYCGWYDLRGELPVLLGNEHVIKPSLLSKIGRPCLVEADTSQAHIVIDNIDSSLALTSVIAGQGLHYHEEFPLSLSQLPLELELELEMLPDAAALLPLATRDLTLGLGVDPEALTPVYLRDNVTY